ncbi:MAG TPA: hypothetical protein VJT16_16745 [Streptosporangiaceae bacterium]|nr:hypothetical protein [Streptosporangiaceae bacterium]
MAFRPVRGRLSLAGVTALVPATVMLAGIGVAGFGAAVPAAASDAAVRAVAPVPGSQLWDARYPATGSSASQATAVATSRDGSTVFVTGGAGVPNGQPDYATIAYDAHTGEQLWASRYNGPGHGFDNATAIALSPDGHTVFVTGESQGSGSRLDYATIAYNAATGAAQWVRRYNGRAGMDDTAGAITVSPGGSTVFVTGTSGGGVGTKADYATVAYNAANGMRLWVSRYNGRASNVDDAIAMAISPNGHLVYVTGRSMGRRSGGDFATVAYQAASGAQRWVSRYNGRANRLDAGQGIAVSPDSRTVYVTGTSKGRTSGNDFATAAYNASTGATRWVSRFNGHGEGTDDATGVAVNSVSGLVYVTGNSQGAATGTDIATIAYRAKNGATAWVSRFDGARREDFARSLAVSPDGAGVFIAGIATIKNSGDQFEPSFAVIGYNAATGARRWWTAIDANGFEQAMAVAVSPDSHSVYATGGNELAATRFVYDTLAVAN